MNQKSHEMRLPIHKFHIDHIQDNPHYPYEMLIRSLKMLVS